MNVISLIVGILSTWYISTMLYAWKGFDGLRDIAGVYGPYESVSGSEPGAERLKPLTFAGRLLSCYWCIASLVGAVLALVALVEWRVLTPFAFAGGAMLLSHGGRTVWRMQNDG